MRYFILVVSLMLLAVLLVACNVPFWLQQQMNVPQPENTAVVDQALIDYGISVYREQYCGVCHQLDPANTTGNFGPAHNQMGLIAAERLTLPNYHGEATSTIEYIRESLLNPQIFYAPGYEATNHHMPPYTHLADEQIDAMVYMLAHQFGDTGN